MWHYVYAHVYVPKIDIKQSYIKDKVNAITHYHIDKSDTDIKLCLHSNYGKATKIQCWCKISACVTFYEFHLVILVCVVWQKRINRYIVNE